MNEFLQEKQKIIKNFLKEYGKVSFVLLLLLLSSVSIYGGVTLITPHKLEVIFLDVGQGDAILVTTPSGKQMLIDGGATNSITSELSKHISYFDRTLDVVVATHPDADHVTGLIPVLTKYNVSTIVTSGMKGDTGIFTTLEEKINDEGGSVHTARKGDVIDFGDGVVAHILYPTGRHVRDTNDASVSLVLTYGEHSFLLTGDLSSPYEPQLLQDSLPRDVTVYKAGHHGSKTSSGEVLLSYIRPEYAVISAGKDNKYGHPHEETLGRLQKYSEEILSTITSGDITFISDGRSLGVKKEK